MGRKLALSLVMGGAITMCGSIVWSSVGARKMTDLYQYAPFMVEAREMQTKLSELETELIDCVPTDRSRVTEECADSKIEYSSLKNEFDDLKNTREYTAYAQEVTRLDDLYLQNMFPVVMVGGVAMVAGALMLRRRRG